MNPPDVNYSHPWYIFSNGQLSHWWDDELVGKKIVLERLTTLAENGDELAQQGLAFLAWKRMTT